MMNWKGFRRKRSCLKEILPPHFPGVTAEYHDSRRPVRTSPERRGAAKQQPPLDAVWGGGCTAQSIVTVARASRRSVYLRPWRRQHLAVRSPRFEPKLFSHRQGSRVHSQGSVYACVAGAVCRRHDVAGHGWPAQQFHWLPIPACTAQLRGSAVHHVSGSRPGKSRQRDELTVLAVCMRRGPWR